MKSQTTQIRHWLALFSLAASLQITLGYYDPAAQRWINRDPVNELGGLNLYAMAENDSLNSYDKDGLLKEKFDRDKRERCENACLADWRACVAGRLGPGLLWGAGTRLGTDQHQTLSGCQKWFCRAGRLTGYSKGLLRASGLSILFGLGYVGVDCGSSYWGCMYACSAATRWVEIELMDSTCSQNGPPTAVFESK